MPNRNNDQASRANKNWSSKHPELRRQYNNEWRAKQRKLYEEYKSSVGCKYCGETHPACLDFHHRNPEEKTANISFLIRNRSFESVQDEIKKCDVVCSNCHRKLHYASDSDMER